MAHALLLLRTAAAAATAIEQHEGTWRDNTPVAASAIQSLDGDDWWVEGHGRAFSHNCTGGGPSSGDDAGCAVCTEGANYSAPAVGPHGWYSVESLGMGASWTSSDCVELCAATSDCAAAVWTNPVHGHPVVAAGTGCGFRTAAEVAQGTQAANGTTACVPTGLHDVRISIPATVPGDLVTDLQMAGKVLDPLSSGNHKNPSQVQWWNGVSYTYAKNFSVTAAVRAGVNVRLVLSSVKMGATVSINGHKLGNTTNQFLRYIFDVGPLLTSGQNTLSVRFDRSIDTGGRFMAASGGWDWAPYSRMRDRGGRLEWTRGIVGGVYLAATAAGTVAIDHLSPTILYKGMFPTSMLKDDGTHMFEVNVTTHLAAKTNTSGMLTVTGDWGWPQSKQSASVPVTITAADNGTKAVSVLIEARRVKLWWPRGMGKGRPVLYNVSAQFVPSAAATTSQGDSATGTTGTFVTASRRIGFRTAYLTTGNDTDQAWVAANANGNGYHDASTVMFRINGVPTLMRGGNLIPMESMEGRYVEGMHRQLVKSAAEANMNMLRVPTPSNTRVWGGGIYPMAEFSNACDEEGVMILMDMMYAQGGHGAMVPISEADQERELRHQIRRQSHHPSVIGWTGCNECEQTPAEVMATVAEEDNSRVIRGACPFGLYTSGVHTLTGLPNGQPLRWTQNWHAQNCDDHALWCNKTDSEVPWQGGAEQHGPYNNGNGGMWRTINSNGGGGLFTDPALLVAVQPGFLVSAGQPGYFKSETGCTSLSSYESMAATLKPTEYGVNTEPFRERNYAANSLILSYFGAHRDMSVVGVEALQSQTYLSMLAASLERKSDIESWRSTGIWGMLMWQLNEIWPTGGWGSLEYGTPVPGQVIGGRWKIMHHALQQSAFADVVASCGKEMTSTGAGEYGIGGIAGSTANGSALCYIRNDLPTAFVGTVAVEAIHFNTGQTTTLSTVPVSVPAAGEYGSVSFFCAANSTKLSRGKPSVCASFDKLYGLAGCTGGPADCFLNVTVTAADDSTGSSPKQPCRNILLLALPSKLHLPRANVNFVVKDATLPDQDTGTVELTSNATAIYVWLSTLEQGRFSDNAFVLLPGVTKKVWFLPFNKAGTSAVALKASLRVEHLGMYL